MTIIQDACTKRYKKKPGKEETSSGETAFMAYRQ